jgi:hypothetical protein
MSACWRRAQVLSETSQSARPRVTRISRSGITRRLVTLHDDEGVLLPRREPTAETAFDWIVAPRLDRLRPEGPPRGAPHRA